VKRINVTEPYLPPFEEYVEYLKGIWERKWLTNQGPLAKELEQKLQAYHQLSMPVHCVANGSLGLQIALKALGVKGEVITTPFSYVATTACPIWEGCTVRFADIEPDTLTLDPKAVETAITPETEAILATHVFGNPCDCEALEAIAAKYGIVLIFDAAHAFGVSYKGKSLFEYGDVSICSLHATKLFHAVEGGFMVAKDPLVSEKMEWMRRFGHNGEDDFYGVGINAKISEFHASMGLCVLKHIDDVIDKRRSLSCAYDKNLPSEFMSLMYRVGASRNYSYYPVLLETEERLLSVVEALKSSNVIPRRYFYPLLNQFDFFASNMISSCPVAQSVVNRVLCLPMAHFEDVGLMAQAVLGPILEEVRMS
jgi:dTDP-4-amino-4,6-dideoxygalactose transaminase